MQNTWWGARNQFCSDGLPDLRWSCLSSEWASRGKGTLFYRQCWSRYFPPREELNLLVSRIVLTRSYFSILLKVTILIFTSGVEEPRANDLSCKVIDVIDQWLWGCHLSHRTKLSLSSTNLTWTNCQRSFEFFSWGNTNYNSNKERLRRKSGRNGVQDLQDVILLERDRQRWVNHSEMWSLYHSDQFRSFRTC